MDQKLRCIGEESDVGAVGNRITCPVPEILVGLCFGGRDLRGWLAADKNIGFIQR